MACWNFTFEGFAEIFYIVGKNGGYVIALMSD